MWAWGSRAWRSGRCWLREGVLRTAANDREADASRSPVQPKAKSVIWIFLIGGMSHMESFDPKPELNKHAGKTIEESPFKAILDSPYLKKNVREFVPGQHKVQPTIYPMQVGFKKHGQMRHGDQRLVSAFGPARAMIWPSSARCGRPTTITVRSFSFTRAATRSKGRFRRSARGCIGASDR